jgi:hydroxypyruvate reductase
MIKGGKLVQNMNCDGCALVMSDVVSNDLSVISSGCTYNDNTTFSDAIKIITKYSLGKKLPKKVITHLKRGLNTKTMQPNRLTIKNKIIATNHDCLDVMVLKSRRLGFTTRVYSPVKHDVSVSAKKIVRMISEKKNSCIIFGGEPTVQVKGNGKGGRNQELVLQILKLIHGSDHHVLVSSISTDGIDGNTTCAGALSVNNSSNLQKISSYLENNNSYSFFKKYGGLIKTGPTHTNLMDIGLIIKY